MQAHTEDQKLGRSMSGRIMAQAEDQFMVQAQGRRSKSIKAQILTEVADFFGVDADELEGQIFRSMGEWIR